MISADVRLEALKPKGLLPELAAAEIGWARLDAASSTTDSLGALFSVSGDPQEQQAARGAPMLTLKESEDLSLEDRVLPPDRARPSVVQLTLFDKAAHQRTHARAHGRPRAVLHPHGALARTRRGVRADDLPRDLAPRLIPRHPPP